MLSFTSYLPYFLAFYSLFPTVSLITTTKELFHQVRSEKNEAQRLASIMAILPHKSGCELLHFVASYRMKTKTYIN